MLRTVLVSSRAVLARPVVSQAFAGVARRGFQSTACAFGSDHGHSHGASNKLANPTAFPESRSLDAESSDLGTVDHAPKLKNPLMSQDPDRMPTPEEHVVGAEALDHLRQLQGLPPTDMQPLYLEKKGTKNDPAIVEAMNAERVVGCTGFPKGSHEIIWLPVRAGWMSRCGRCGQVFKLKTFKGLDAEINHAH